MTTAVEGEIRKFDALAGRWWDPSGPMKPLHRMNPLRTGWIGARIAAAHGRTGRDLSGLSILDVGCGAGLASEAFARMGAQVTGLDAAGEALEAARAHAEAGGLEIDYREGTPEELAAEGARFDAVVALEVIEHVEDRPAFCAALAALAKPGGGQIFLSTLNRTARSFLMAKVGAEYVLRMLPVGTHDWRMFVTPGELGTELRRAGLQVTDIAGMTMDPLTGRWRESRDLGVNYLMAARR
ncbi:bifunctional 2-polyprenyl-6-hydroxyphenol methylase/3-demethylubiquinol 3-O-methyltransferase UbiG [Falsiroseomonas oryziterrae]|uniref:bifunctional 2-polyprenyl-6-hydroxyphenol methylase/3-demethylubiquinol 3-O-methyltransferase UbiG n=1 Tax=Falsiroseomonas oryziterrae TaxID=2911368 RepID=UPI001F02D203|nr:bifunctional 2-polyprenyl-6-hydroxyphenol methylase/3-demethylubiquinol 3-O-methyltransferase UbiG [Roseomonas sp. NPKOSM-4]